MPQFRQYPEALTTLPTDALIMDRVGVGTVWTPVSNFTPGSSGTSGFDTLAIFRATSIAAGVNITQVNGYRTAGDGGAMRLARVSAAGPGIWQSADGAFWQVNDNEPNVMMFGAYNDGLSHQITSADIAANPQWIGSYSVGTEWNSVAGQELVYTCLAIHSVVGTVHWNIVSGGINRPFNIAPGGTFLSNQTILIVAQGFYMRGNSRLSSVWFWNGSPTTSLFYLNSGSYFVIERLGFSDNVSTNQLVTLDHNGSPSAATTQQGSFRDCNFFGGGPVWTNVIVAINPVSGGTGQGDTLMFENCLIDGSAVANVELNGQNVLSIIFLGGNQQIAFQDGIQLFGASAFVYGTSFQNSAIDFFHQAPIQHQIAMGGADFHSYSGAGGTEINRGQDIRSENVVPFICAAGNGRADSIGFDGGIMVGGWTASGFFPLGFLLNAGTKKHLFMLVDDGGPDWFLGDVSGSTSLAVNLSATWTVNQWAGFICWERFTSGIAVATSVTSNTATTATLSPAFGSTTAGRQIKIGGLAGSSPPSWDSASAGHSTVVSPGVGQGFTTTAGSAAVTIGSDVAPINVNDYVVIPGAWSLTQAGFTQTSALIGKVLSITGGGTVANLSRAATKSVTNGPGYFGTPLSDNNLSWLDIDSDAIVGVLKGDNIYAPYGRARSCGSLDAMFMGRLDWWRTNDLVANNSFNFSSRTYQSNNQPQALATIGAGGLDLTQSIRNGPLVTIDVTASCTFTWPSENVGSQAMEINAVQSGAGDIVITWAGSWAGPATTDLGSTGGKITHIAAQWDYNLTKWVSRGITGPY